MESKFSKIKKGEFFKFLGKTKVYVYDGGGLVRGFNYHSFNDSSDFKTTKTNRVIEIGFTF